MADVKTADPDVDRLLKHAHRIEAEGKKEIAEIVYSAASEIARLRQQRIDTSKVSRVEVINHATGQGRDYVFWRGPGSLAPGTEPPNVTLSLQDEGRTLKVFIDANSPTKAAPND